MQNQLKAVEEFHKTFKITYNDQPTVNSTPGQNLLRYELMREENEEYLQAVKDQNLTEIADALGDMLYILCGTIIEHGMQDKIEAVFNEIHRSNMSKLDENGMPIYREDGKVIKGPNYSRPNFEGIL